MHETRYRILQCLAQDGPATVSQLVRRVGMKAATIRHHLIALRAEGLVDMDLQHGAVGRPPHLFRALIDDQR
ncbi:MAG: ArsR family transcriptional regulator [Chloroflexi bacterium]|nr:ArsR family transcriptional regulator [Chloroflexota bacterium]